MRGKPERLARGAEACNSAARGAAPPGILPAMPLLSPAAAHVLAHPAEFVRLVLKGFRANQGLLLAGAVAYYALLSVVPLLILVVIALSHWVDQAELLETLGRYLEWLMPGQSGAVVTELANFVQHRQVIGWVLFGTMLFFSSLAFTVLEKAMSVIFLHRIAIRRRQRQGPSTGSAKCFHPLRRSGWRLQAA